MKLSENILRWLLPKGKMSRDQFSQLMLVYTGMAADIVEIFEAFRENKVYNEFVCLLEDLFIDAGNDETTPYICIAGCLELQSTSVHPCNWCKS